MSISISSCSVSMWFSYLHLRRAARRLRSAALYLLGLLIDLAAVLRVLPLWLDTRLLMVFSLLNVFPYQVVVYGANGLLGNAILLGNVLLRHATPQFGADHWYVLCE